MEGQTLFPPHREAAKLISGMGPGDFISDRTLEQALDAKRESDAFRFEKMRLDEALLAEHEMALVRESRDGEKGYRVATDEDKVMLLGPRSRRRAEAAVIRHRRVLLAVQDESSLSESAKKSLERQMQQNAFVRLAIESSKSRKRIERLTPAFKALSDKS